MPSWTGNLTSQAPVAGPAGFYYADVPNRTIAFIIDGIIVGIAGFVVDLLARSVLGINVFGGSFHTTTSLLVSSILTAIVFGAYFIYTWVAMRATPGMRLLGMQVGHETDGRTMTFQQAAYRFAIMWGPYLVSLLLLFVIPAIGLLTYLVALGWGILLLITTAQSPTKQGLHDKYAQTMVVKAARQVG